MIMFNMRSAIAQFITSRLLSSGQDTSNITEAVNRINAELRNILESMVSFIYVHQMSKLATSSGPWRPQEFPTLTTLKLLL